MLIAFERKATVSLAFPVPLFLSPLAPLSAPTVHRQSAPVLGGNGTSTYTSHTANAQLTMVRWDAGRNGAARLVAQSPSSDGPGWGR